MTRIHRILQVRHLRIIWHALGIIPMGFPRSLRIAQTIMVPTSFRKNYPAHDFTGAARRIAAVYGDGSNVRDWLYVEDHCEALAQAIQLGKPGETYNIGGITR